METTAAKEIARLPQILQSAVALWFEKLAEQDGALGEDLVAPATRFVACSEFGARIALREHRWFTAKAGSFVHPPDDAELCTFVRSIAISDADVVEVKSELRRYRNRFLLRVLWREVHDLADLDETLRQLSLLADAVLDAAARYSVRQMEPRFGHVKTRDGEPVPLIILGMGKLGGYELNFSSDIDVMFCYSQDGQTDGRRSLSAQEYFARLSRQVISLIDEVTVDGFVFRMDTRLRPFGESGPPVVSFAALESYLLQHGRDWERYAYVKARIVGPQPSAELADELQNELIQPFVYRRYLDYGVFESVREMQSLIAAEVRRRELADNIKLGPGGIREAEFIVQALQLVRGGSEVQLQCRELQTVLPRLVSARGIGASDAEKMRNAYRFLRRLENFIQAIRDEQTHDLPGADIDRARLCLALHYADWQQLVDDLDAHRNAISAQFSAIAIRSGEDENPAAEVFSRLFETQADAKTWRAALHDSVGEEAESLAAEIVSFSGLSALQTLDSVSRGRLQRFIPALIELVLQLDRPLSALTRTLSVTEKILRRSAYLALLNENRHALARLVDLCRRSQYVAERIARYPVLLDELLDPRIYSDGVQKQELAEELRERLEVQGDSDSESRMHVVAQFQRAAMFRIAVADFSDELPIMKVSDGLTWLAEVVLDAALDAAWNDLAERHGVPTYVVDGVTSRAGFGIVGYGKLGGLELSYGSDLDIVFLHDSRGEKQVTDGAKPLDNTMFFSRLVRRVVHFLTTQTSSGELYDVDTRLRPDGRSGLLVTSTEAFERYQEENAWTWEHQALLRARAVAGSARVAEEFERIRQETLSSRVRRNTLRNDVISMRSRMRKELDRSDADNFDLKHGTGGIGDIEFLVQYLVLEAAGEHRAAIEFSDNIRQIDALIAIGVVDDTTGRRLQATYRDYRLFVHRRVLDGRPAVGDVRDFAEDRAFVTSTWQNWLN